MACCVVTASNELGLCNVHVDAHWVLRIEGQTKPLGLQTIMTHGKPVYYIFANSPSEGGVPVADLPECLRELLLFTPLVPLRRTATGFQGLRIDQWSALLVKEQQQACCTTPTMQLSAQDSMQQGPDADLLSWCEEDEESNKMYSEPEALASDLEENDDLDDIVSFP